MREQKTGATGLAHGAGTSSTAASQSSRRVNSSYRPGNSASSSLPQQRPGASTKTPALPRQLTIRNTQGDVVNRPPETTNQDSSGQAKRRPPLSASRGHKLNADLADAHSADASGAQPTPQSELLAAELESLRKDNIELNDLVQSLKNRLQEKTIEANRVKKKLQQQLDKRKVDQEQEQKKQEDPDIQL